MLKGRMQLKKLISWYNLLVASGMTDFGEAEATEEAEAADNTPEESEKAE